MALEKYGFRQYLKEKGYADQDITYDQNNQSVNVGGKFFANATPEADGSTYNTRPNLETAYKAFQVQNSPGYKDRTNTLLNKAEERLGQPTKQFQYNAQSDPLYQNALQAAQAGAATAQGNALARLRSMGQGKSSYSEGVANQIGQQAVADVNSKVLPQLNAQAYQRFMDEQQAGRQNTMDMIGLGQTYGDLGQRDLDNSYRDNAFGEQQKQNNLSAANQVGQQLGRVLAPKDDYSNLYNQTDAPLSLQGQQFQSNQEQQQFDNQMAVKQQERQAQQFAASQGLDWARLNQSQQQFVAEQAMKQQQINADQDPNSLDNQYKRAQINSLTSKTDAPDEVFLTNRDAMTEQLRSGQIKPQDALKTIDEDQQIGYYTPEQADKLRNVVRVLFPNTGTPSKSPMKSLIPTVGGTAENIRGDINAVKNLPSGFMDYLNYLGDTGKSALPTKDSISKLLNPW